MTTADVLRPAAVGDKSAPYHPMEPKPHPPVGWGQYILDSTAELLAPRLPPVTYVHVQPSLPEKYSCAALMKYVVNVLGTQQEILEARLIHLTPNDVEGLKECFSYMGKILQITNGAKLWIQEHKTAHLKERPIKILRIEGKLERSQRLLGQLFKYLPDSGQMLKPAPKEWAPTALRSPGIPNEQNGCFMNSTLQGIFGDPICRQYIAQNPHQHDTVKLYALQFAAASYRKDFTPLRISKEIRKLYGLADGRQHDAHEAMMGLTGPISGGKNSVLDRNAYNGDNPIVQKLIRRATYPQAAFDLDKVAASDKAYFKGNVQEMERFEWYLPISPTSDPKSLAMESLLERALCPAPKDCINYAFSIDGAPKKIEVAAEQEINTFARRPEYLLFNFLRAQYDYQAMRTYRVGDPFDIDQIFYLDGKHVETNQGGQYEVRWFSCHSGSASGGHYVNYKKVGAKWFYYSDSTVKEASAAEVDKAVKTCYLMFAGRVDTDLTNAEITQKVKENVAASKAKALKSAVEAAKKPLPKGDSPSKRENELERIDLFHTVLNMKEQEDPSLLPDLFKAMPDAFREFMTQVLILEGKISKEDEVLKHLADLKTIGTEYLTMGLNDHIVAQYQHVKAQQLELLQDELEANSKQKTLLNQSKQTEAMVASVSMLLKQAKFKDTCYQTLLAKVDSVDKTLLLRLADLLIPGLSKLIEKDVKARLEYLLKGSAAWQDSLQQQLEMGTKLLSE